MKYFPSAIEHPSNPVRRLAGQLIQSVFARQVGTTALTQGAILLLSMATSAITARWLGPAGKGELAMILMVPAMLQMFLGVGLGPANVYYVGSGRIPVAQLTSNSMVFSLLGTIVGLLAMLPLFIGDLLKTLLPGVSSGYLMLGMIALPLGLMNANLCAILQGLLKIYTLNFLNLLRALLSVVIMALLLIWLKFGIMGAIVASLAVQVTLLLVTCRHIKLESTHFYPKWNPQVVRPTLSYGLKCYVANLLQFFNYRLDVFIVNFFLGPASVGIYGVSVALAELLWQIPSAASFVIFPKAANSPQETMNRFTPRIFWIILAITLVAAFGLALFGKQVILIIFSSAFLDSYLPLLVLLPGVVLLGAGKVLANDMAGRGYPVYNSIASGVSLIITIILDLVLIPSMGVVGAAIASTASYSLTFFVLVGFYFSVSRMKHVSI